MMYRKHFKRTPFGAEYTHTTEEMSVYDHDAEDGSYKKGDPRLVDKVFDAAKIRALDMTKLRKKLAKKAAP